MLLQLTRPAHLSRLICTIIMQHAAILCLPTHAHWYSVTAAGSLIGKCLPSLQRERPSLVKPFHSLAALQICWWPYHDNDGSNIPICQGDSSGHQ